MVQHYHIVHGCVPTSHSNNQGNVIFIIATILFRTALWNWRLKHFHRSLFCFTWWKTPTCVLLFPSAFCQNALLVHPLSNHSCVQLQHDSSLITCFCSPVTSTDHRDFSSNDHQREGSRQYTTRIFSEHTLVALFSNGEVWHYSKNTLLIGPFLTEVVQMLHNCNCLVVKVLSSAQVFPWRVCMFSPCQIRCECVCACVLWCCLWEYYHLGDSWDWHQSPPAPWLGEKQNHPSTKGCI